MASCKKKGMTRLFKLITMKLIRRAMLPWRKCANLKKSQIKQRKPTARLPPNEKS